MFALNVCPISERKLAGIPGSIYTERYRSGHNGADSKNCWHRYREGLKSLDFTGFPGCGRFHFFSMFALNVCPISERKLEDIPGSIYTERYRSGHNGADSKSV